MGQPCFGPQCPSIGSSAWLGQACADSVDPVSSLNLDVARVALVHCVYDVLSRGSASCVPEITAWHYLSRSTCCPRDSSTSDATCLFFCRKTCGLFSAIREQLRNVRVRFWWFFFRFFHALVLAMSFATLHLKGSPMA